MNSGIGHLNADSSKSDDSKLLSLNLTAGKLLFLLLGKLGNLLILTLGLHPVHPSDDIPGGQKKSGQDQLLYTVCIGSRSVEYHHALLRVFS